MDLDGLGVSEGAVSLHAVKNLPAKGRHHGIMVYYLVPRFCDCISKPGTEQHRRALGVELRQRRANQGSVPLRCSECNSHTKIMSDQFGSSNKRGHKTLVQGFTICWETHDGRKCSAGLSYTICAEAACHSAYDFRLKHCASNGGAKPNAVNRQARMTGLNLHFILVILFSTNKLKPEKT